jgi:hypothetical protein
MMLFGGGLNGNGFIGMHPSLSSLDANGNMIFSTDFRDVYSTVMKDWLCVPPAIVDQAMLNGNYNTLNLGFNCTTAGIVDATASDLQHFVINRNEDAILHFTMDVGRKLDVRIFNFLGQELGQLTNEYYMPGVHDIDIKNGLKTRLAAGQYIYRIQTQGQQYSSQFMIM